MAMFATASAPVALYRGYSTTKYHMAIREATRAGSTPSFSRGLSVSKNTTKLVKLPHEGAEVKY